MKYSNVKVGEFLQRPNRFIAEVIIDGKPEIVHVKNTGRCRDLLLAGAKVYLEPAKDETRKTKWSLIAVKKGNRIINIDSQIPNKVVEEALHSGALKLPGISPKFTQLKSEYTYEDSRFDFYFETETQKGFIEVKGVTLEVDDIVKFPDAPTQRGTKHINGLIKAVQAGYSAFIIFVIQMKGTIWFEPNFQTDMNFSESLKKASEKGVHILAFDSFVDHDSISMGEYVPVKLK